MCNNFPLKFMSFESNVLSQKLNSYCRIFKINLKVIKSTAKQLFSLVWLCVRFNLIKIFSWKTIFNDLQTQSVPFKHIFSAKQFLVCQTQNKTSKLKRDNGKKLKALLLHINSISHEVKTRWNLKYFVIKMNKEQNRKWTIFRIN